LGIGTLTLIIEFVLIGAVWTVTAAWGSVTHWIVEMFRMLIMFGDVTIVGVNVTFDDANVTLDGDSVTLNGDTGGVVMSLWARFTILGDVCVTHLFVVKLSSSVTISGEWRLIKYCDVQLLESEDDESDPLGDGGNEFPDVNKPRNYCEEQSILKYKC